MSSIWQEILNRLGVFTVALIVSMSLHPTAIAPAIAPNLTQESPTPHTVVMAEETPKTGIIDEEATSTGPAQVDIATSDVNPNAEFMNVAGPEGTPVVEPVIVPEEKPQVSPDMEGYNNGGYVR